MSIQMSDEHWRLVDESLFIGHQIQALKFLRDASGCSLRDAINELPVRYAFLRQTRAERFIVDHDGYWAGFVS